MTTSRCTRFWYRGQKIGVPVTPDNRTKIKFIFIREDGWAIGCEKEAYSEVFALWAGEWLAVVEI